ncbi:hypothetical protein GQ53DRAFT_814866 [Thozetella sp. PMI_491]|nr:hypothetical protein GQ53DRAFT_814866 [Thozetella sp. PMI_491]
MAMHYRSTADEPLEQRTLIDREFFEACKRSLEPSVIGLDISTNAIRYGTATGLLASGWTENLELSSPSSELAEALRDVNIVLCTGGGSYVGPNTFARIAAANKNPSQLWMVAFVLRTYTFEGTATVLSHYGLITEKVPGVAFKQRRFKTVSEQSWAVSAVLDRGLDPLGLEEDGWLYADCYITRPQLQASKQPAAELIKPRIEQGSNAED